MADLERKLQQDRASRDAARRLVEADLGILRGEGEKPGIKQRAADGARETSRTLAGQAADVVSAHPLATGGIVALILLLFFRNSVLDLVIHLLEGEDEDEDGDPPLSRHDDDDDDDDEPDAERTGETTRSSRIRRH